MTTTQSLLQYQQTTRSADVNVLQWFQAQGIPVDLSVCNEALRLHMADPEPDARRFEVKGDTVMEGV